MSSSGDSTVLFSRVPLKLNRSRVRDFAARLRQTVTDGREFCCLITTDAELARLNRTFLGKDHATDVLSFPSGAMGGPLGDIAISAGRASEQAREYGHSLEEEIAILMLHGVLHLLGMDHERDRGRMAKTERQLRKDLNLPSGVIERVEL